MTKLIIRTAKEKVRFEPPEEDAGELLLKWVDDMYPLVKRLRGNQRKSALRSGNSSKAHREKSTSVL